MKAETIYSFPPFRFNLLARELTKDGLPLALSPKACGLLILLVQRPQQVLLHTDLIQALWPRGHVSRTILPQLIRELRQRLDDSAQQPRWIKTVNRTGYRFIGELQVLPHTSSATKVRAATSSAGNCQVPMAEDLGRVQALGVRMALQRRHTALNSLLLQLRQAAPRSAGPRSLAMSDLLEALACTEVERTGTARGLLSRALSLWPHADDMLIQALAQTTGGSLALLDGQPIEATSALRPAWHQAERTGMFLLKHECAWGLGVAHAMLAQWEDAASWLERAVRLTQSHTSPWLLERQCRRFGSIALEIARQISPTDRLTSLDPAVWRRLEGRKGL